MVMGLLYVVGLLQSTDAQQDVRPAVGVTFERQAFALRPLADAYTATFVLKVPDRPHVKDIRFEGLRTQDNAIAKDRIEQSGHNLNSAIRESNELNTILKRHWQELTMITESFRQGNKQKRGLFNFVGSISNSLFGTATEAQVKALQNQLLWVKDVAVAGNHNVADLYSRFTSLINNTQDRFGNVMHAVNASAAAISQLNDNLRTLTEDVTKDIGRINQQLSSVAWRNFRQDQLVWVLQKISTQYRQIENMRDWFTALNTLLEGRISPFLVPVHDMTRTLHKIDRWCRERDNGIRPIMTAGFLDQYYKMNVLLSMIIDNTLIIRFPVPLTNPSNNFQIYAIYTFPVPIHGHDIARTGYTLLRTTAKYIAVRSGSSRTATLTAEEANACIHQNAGFCSRLSVTRTVTNPDCITAIYQNLQEYIHTRCNFQVYPNAPIQSDIRPLEGNRFLLTNMPSPLSIECRGHVRTVKIRQYSIVEIPCKCHIETTLFDTINRVTHCLKTGQSMQINVTHPINYPYLKAFHALPKTPKLVTHLESSTLQHLKLPNITKYLNQMHTDMGRDVNLALSTKKIAEGAMAHDTSFRPPPSFNMSYSWDGLTSDQWCLVGITVYLAIHTGVGMYILLRLAQLTIIVRTLPIAEAASVALDKAVNFKHSEDVIDTRTFLDDVNIDEIWKIITMTFIVLTVLYKTCVLIRRGCRSKRDGELSQQWYYSPSTSEQYIHFYLQTCSNTECVIIYICSVPYEKFGTTIVDVPRPKHVEVYARYWKPQVMVQWQGKIIIKVNSTVVKIKPRTNIRISHSQATKLSRVITTQIEQGDIFKQYSPILFRLGSKLEYKRARLDSLPVQVSQTGKARLNIQGASLPETVQEGTTLVEASAPIISLYPNTESLKML